jgi:metal-responsive CopG/Arc/MetJ family transcriptional regulator
MNATIELPSALYDFIVRLSQEAGRSESDLILDALYAYLRERDESWPRSIGMVEDAELSGADIEDWLKANWRPEDDWGRA